MAERPPISHLGERLDRSRDNWRRGSANDRWGAITPYLFGAGLLAFIVWSSTPQGGALMYAIFG